jgi:hypothetical protein
VVTDLAKQGLIIISGREAEITFETIFGIVEIGGRRGSEDIVDEEETI